MMRMKNEWNKNYPLVSGTGWEKESATSGNCNFLTNTIQWIELCFMFFAYNQQIITEIINEKKNGFLFIENVKTVKGVRNHCHRLHSNEKSHVIILKQ